MTLEEAIEKYEKKAKKFEQIAFFTPIEYIASSELEYVERQFKELDQLVKWLKHYKLLREQKFLSQLKTNEMEDDLK